MEGGVSRFRIPLCSNAPNGRIFFLVPLIDLQCYVQYYSSKFRGRKGEKGEKGDILKEGGVYNIHTSFLIYKMNVGKIHPPIW